jgi:ParB family chromosome partitioning protein
VLAYLVKGALTTGHARAIATAPDPQALAELIVEKGLSVREAEKLSRQALDRPAPASGKSGSGTGAAKDADTRALEADVAARLGLSVDIRHGASGGEIRVQYKTLEQLDDVCRRLSGQGAG